MTTFATEFLGCKVSMVDAQQIRERLAEDGHREQPAELARVRVVNTCCVTAEAVAKSRKAVRRAARTADRVLVTGCAAALPGAFVDLGRRVEVISARSERIADHVSAGVGTLGCAGGSPLPFARTRAYLKIQDGCSFGCSYCVIPQVRGASRSRSAAGVLREAERRVGQGHRELVMTGVNLGCFRDRGAGLDLAGLLQAVAAVPGVRRVRLSSIEVNHLSDRLLHALGSTPGVARHLHVPMQSGSDGVLRAMRRRYTADGFIAKMGRARQLVPGVNLTSDVIVGHPSEDEAAFAETLAAVRRIGFTKVHTFPYSPRPGTADAGDDLVPAAVKRDRSRRLRMLSDAQGARHRAAKIGRRELVLVETDDGRGYCDDYTPFVVEGAGRGAMVDALGRAVEGGAVLATLRR
ncbi:MAG: threonylcarbamoyladenosine tRNA methylthiotransferase MtaB [Gaiellales bacterium]|nr:threonylcarbamoyladenosine tRNA methylthiotransferase MtaB [Gaiellales bacterium]